MLFYLLAVFFLQVPLGTPFPACPGSTLNETLPECLTNARFTELLERESINKNMDEFNFTCRVYADAAGCFNKHFKQCPRLMLILEYRQLRNIAEGMTKIVCQYPNASDILEELSICHNETRLCHNADFDRQSICLSLKQSYDCSVSCVKKYCSQDAQDFVEMEYYVLYESIYCKESNHSLAGLAANTWLLFCSIFTALVVVCLE